MGSSDTTTIVLRSLFFVLGWFMVDTLSYTIATDGLPFRKDLLTPWMTATLVDFYINILAIGVWIVYKESNWINAILWIVLLICLGSITTCAYIVFEFFKLSAKEASQDPIYYVLLQQEKKEGSEPKSTFSVAAARVLFGALGGLMLGTLIYTIATYGSPFRNDVLTPWLVATLIDFYINVVAISNRVWLGCELIGFHLQVWVSYRESSWIAASFWILLFICFGSVTTCVYIVLKLPYLSAQDPTSFSSVAATGLKRVFSLNLIEQEKAMKEVF